MLVNVMKSLIGAPIWIKEVCIWSDKCGLNCSNQKVDKKKNNNKTF